MASGGGDAMPLTSAISETSCARGRAQPYKHGGEASKNSAVPLAAYGLRSSPGAALVTVGYLSALNWWPATNLRKNEIKEKRQSNKAR